MASMTARALICLTAAAALFCPPLPVEAAPAPTTQEATKAAHPFFREELYPRWSEMTPLQLEANLKEAALRINNRRRELEAVNAQTATFENTFGALSRSTEEAEQAEMYARHLYFTDAAYEQLADTYESNSGAIREAHYQLLHSSRIQNTLQQWAKTPQAATLPPALRYLVELQLEKFTPATDDKTGAQLNKKEAELHKLCLQYANNIRNVTNTWYYVFNNRNQLDGVPPGTVAAMESAARQRGFGTAEQPAWLFTLQMRSITDVLKYCRVEETRKKCWQGVYSPGNTRSYDNGPIVLRIIRLRQEIAKLKGYNSHADSQMTHSLMGSGKQALAFIDDMLRKIQPHIQKLNQATLNQASQQCGKTITALNPWDLHYYMAEATHTLNKFSLQEIRPYLEYEHTLLATFKYFGELYGLRIQEVPTAYVKGGQVCHEGYAEIWHPDVRVFAVYDADTGKHYGSFYLDAYSRDGRKYSTSTQLISYGTAGENGQEGFPPLVVMMLELHKPAPGNTQLLSHLELRMIFHELGHVFHLLLGKGEYKELSALYVARDFIELPAQLQELRAWEADTLCAIGRHYLTGAPMPRELALKVATARHDADYISYLRQQLLISKLDLEMHTHYDEKFRGKSLDHATAEILAPYSIPTTVIAPSVLRNFPHCIEGYDARYYAYILAEVMAADIHEEFKRHGLNNSATGRSFRKAVLEPGNSRPAAELYRAFMGRNVSTDAFFLHLKN